MQLSFSDIISLVTAIFGFISLVSVGVIKYFVSVQKERNDTSDKHIESVKQDLTALIRDSKTELNSRIDNTRLSCDSTVTQASNACREKFVHLEEQFITFQKECRDRHEN